MRQAQKEPGPSLLPTSSRSSLTPPSSCLALLPSSGCSRKRRRAGPLRPMSDISSVVRSFGQNLLAFLQLKPETVRRRRLGAPLKEG